MKSFIRDGLPPLGKKLGSVSSESEYQGHLAASLDTSVMFAGFNTLTFHDSGKSAIWAFTNENDVLTDWRNEVDIHLKVCAVLHDAISAAGLGNTLSYFNSMLSNSAFIIGVR